MIKILLSARNRYQSVRDGRLVPVVAPFGSGEAQKEKSKSHFSSSGEVTNK
jgi:hypothetical protein